MAVMLPGTENLGSETIQFFQDFQQMHGMIRRFGNIEPFVAPNRHSVRSYSTKKLKSLFFEKMVWRPNGQIPDRRIIDGQVAKSLIYSEYFGDPKIEHYTRFCVLVRTHLRAQKLHSHLPRVHEGIGLDFFSHMEKFLQLLEDLLNFSRSKRNGLMLGIRLPVKFIDSYIGQFIHEFFWFMVHAGKYPREHYPATRHG